MPFLSQIYVMNNLPDDIINLIFSYGEKDFLFTGTINKKTFECKKKIKNTIHLINQFLNLESDLKNLYQMD